MTVGFAWVKESKQIMQARYDEAEYYIEHQYRMNGKYITKDLHSLTKEVNDSIIKHNITELGVISWRTCLKAFRQAQYKGYDVSFYEHPVVEKACINGFVRDYSNEEKSRWMNFIAKVKDTLFH